jgi:hypothetical protein
MLRRSISGLWMFAAVGALVALATLTGCPGGNAQIGQSCGGNDDCHGTLQCLSERCVPRCTRAPECGDGYGCDDDGLCQRATGQPGEHCKSEVDCAAGLSCQIDGTTDESHVLLASCTADHAARASGAPCEDDSDCRNGTCALGRCVDLCRDSRDCGIDHSCMKIPHVAIDRAVFAGCLPTQGEVTWSIPVRSPSAQVALPIPEAARSAALVMSVDGVNQRVGAASVQSPLPGATRLYSLPCTPGAGSCSTADALDRYYKNPLRHLPQPVQSVLLIPSGPAPTLEVGTYRVQVSSFRPDGTTGSAIPRVTAVVRLDTADPSTTRTLDLHFFFLDLADHACPAMTEGGTLNAASADAAPFFKRTYLSVLRTTFIHANISIGTITLEDLPALPRLDTLDTLDLDDVEALLSHGKYADGINVFFVRSLAPAGLQAYAPNPGPAGLAGTARSGIVIGLDTLCYRDWTAMARLTAHELARYMGLYHNVELETPLHPEWRDLIDDGDNGAGNLMYFSELAGPEQVPAGTDLSPGQADMLRRSPVLR